MYSFFNAIRGNNTPNEYQSVLAVLKKVMVLQDCAQNEMDYDELYQLMESVATDFEIPNPFPEKERFVDIYRTLQGFDELSWTDILEYGDDRSKFRVPESVVDEMEKNFIDGFQEVLHIGHGFGKETHEMEIILGLGVGKDKAIEFSGHFISFFQNKIIGF